MSCPKCGEALEDYSNQEGGWCPKCEEWYPPDIVRERMEEEDPPEYDPELDYDYYEDDEDA